MFKFCKLFIFFVLMLSSCSREEQIAAAVSVAYMASPLSGKLISESYDNSMQPEVAKIDKECKKEHTYNGMLDPDRYKYCFDKKYNDYEKEEFLKQTRED